MSFSPPRVTKRPLIFLAMLMLPRNLSSPDEAERLPSALKSSP